jgi:hypothetical protein
MPKVETEFPDHREIGVPSRSTSSMFIIVERARQAVRAYVARDESACRAELAYLADEAKLLATMTPLVPSDLDHRQTVASGASTAKV